MQTSKTGIETELIDTRDIAAIAFIILANRLAKITEESQVKIQEHALIEAAAMFKLSSPEGLECLLSMNFPIIQIKGELDEG
jgi:hypothetical protein